MTLVVFDLDGTLLDKGSKISTYTAETLAKMRARNIPYTVATGRTLRLPLRHSRTITSRYRSASKMARSSGHRRKPVIAIITC